MPDWVAGVANANVNTERSVSIKQVFAGGYGFSVQLGNGLLGGADYSLNEISTLRAAIGDASNFAIISQAETITNSVAPQNTIANDDSYGPNVTANLRFVNDSEELFTFTIAGPLKSLFAGDGIVLVEPDSGAAGGSGPKILADLIAAVEAMVNNSFAPANSYSFAGGERARRAMKPSSRPLAIPLEEPTDSVT